MNMTRPLPLPTPTTQPYWDRLSRHEVWIQFSPSLGRYVFYPRVLAPGTLADDLEWRQISGAGTLVSFTVAERPVAPQFADTVPQIPAVVEWAEGPVSPPSWWTSTLPSCWSACPWRRYSPTTPRPV